MDPAFWLTRWQEGRIGFHEGAPNAFLAKHVDRLASYKRVLVPLCGKAEDLAFLAGHGHEVVGIELVEDAVRQFFAEHRAEPVVEERRGMRCYSWDAITIFAGDLFATTAELVGPIDAIYDRAALVALPPDTRVRYAEHLRKLAPAARRELLVTIDYPPDAMAGPPFCVTDAEVHRLFADADIELLGESVDPRGRLDGKMVERCYELRFAR